MIRTKAKSGEGADKAEHAGLCSLCKDFKSERNGKPFGGLSKGTTGSDVMWIRITLLLPCTQKRGQERTRGRRLL